MNLITLTTDWGTASHYAGVVKGVILSYNNDARIIDISHDVKHFDISHAAYVLKNTYASFPKKTIHILAVKTEASIEQPHVIILYDDHYFIGADNGCFSLMFDAKPEKIIEIEILQDSNYFTFPERDVFAKVAAQLAQGKSMDEFGHQRSDLFVSFATQPVYSNDSIQGTIVFIDGYQNLITNISEKQFKEIGNKRAFVCKFGGRVVRKILKAYSDQIPGELVAFFNSYGMLEIAISFGNAAELLRLQVNDRVRIDFE